MDQLKRWVLVTKGFIVRVFSFYLDQLSAKLNSVGTTFFLEPEKCSLQNISDVSRSKTASWLGFRSTMKDVTRKLGRQRHPVALLGRICNPLDKGKVGQL